ncbi:MAG: HIT domain-containing protein [Patescibacteria group bacterium]
MKDKNCLFCKIVEGLEPSKKVLEVDEFIVIKNKYPKAPIHVLVIDKKHREKEQSMKGDFAADLYWDKLMSAAWQTLVKLGLDKTGYKIINNGAGYNHFEHQHLHIMGGSKTEPGGES